MLRSLLYYNIITIIRKIKSHHQRADINSNHLKVIEISDYHDVYKEFLSVRIKNLLQNSRTEISLIAEISAPSFTLNDVTIAIPINEDSYSDSHFETPSTEYNLKTANNSSVAFTMPEIQELITNVVNDLLFSEITSPEDELQAYSVSEHTVFYLQLLTALDNIS